MDRKQIGWERVDWIYPAWNSEKQGAFMKDVVNVWVS